MKLPENYFKRPDLKGDGLIGGNYLGSFIVRGFCVVGYLASAIVLVCNWLPEIFTFIAVAAFVILGILHWGATNALYDPLYDCATGVQASEGAYDWLLLCRY